MGSTDAKKADQENFPPPEKKIRKYILSARQPLFVTGECYCGGKPRNKGPHNKRGMGTKKIPVVALVERGGNVRALPVEKVDAITLRKIINDTVETGSRIMDDSDRMELAIKNAVGKRLMYQEAKAS